MFCGLHGRLGLDGIHGLDLVFLFPCFFGRLTQLNKPIRFFLKTRSGVSVGWGWIGDCQSSTEPFCKSLIRKTTKKTVTIVVNFFRPSN